MSNKKNIFLNLIFIFLFFSLGYFALKSETKNELNIYSGRKSHLIEPLINEFESHMTHRAILDDVFDKIKEIM